MAQVTLGPQDSNTSFQISGGTSHRWCLLLAVSFSFCGLQWPLSLLGNDKVWRSAPCSQRGFLGLPTLCPPLLLEWAPMAPEVAQTEAEVSPMGTVSMRTLVTLTLWALGERSSVSSGKAGRRLLFQFTALASSHAWFFEL